MSLGPCQDCSAMISEAAQQCPRCGRPFPVRPVAPAVPTTAPMTRRQQRRARASARDMILNREPSWL